MKIRIPKEKIPEILRLLEMVNDPAYDVKGAIIDSEQGQFIRVYERKYCSECGKILEQSQWTCPDCKNFRISKAYFTKEEIKDGYKIKAEKKES